MTIEQKIKTMTPNYASRSTNMRLPLYVQDPTKFPWFEAPLSVHTDIRSFFFISLAWRLEQLKEIDLMIKEADEAECLTSSSEYIRECKKWYMKNR